MTKTVEIGRVTVNGVPKIVAREVDAVGNYGAAVVSWNVTDENIGAAYCRISMNAGGTLKAELLDKSGFLWVNQREYIRKDGIKTDDVIYFGAKKTKIDVSKFIGAVWGWDISHLQTVWENYQKSVIGLRRRTRVIAKLGSLPSLVGMLVAGGVGLGGSSMALAWRVGIPIAFVIGVVLYEFLIRKDENTLEGRLEKLENDLSDVYVCPSCKRYLRERWHLLSRRDACPHCKARFYVK
jgi:hypothetical protein